MKPSRHKKVIGICLGDRSLLAAEVLAGPKPLVRRLAEMAYPEGVSMEKPEELGKALQQFLHERQFSAGAAVIGIPAKWIVVRSKEVPAANDATLANMLRLGIETDFPSDLKDMIYDFRRQKSGAGSSSAVLLMGTQRKNVEASISLCKAARLTPIAVTPSALALGQATNQDDDKDLLVLSVGATSSELSVHDGGDAGAIRHLRATAPQPMFVSELRRVVSTLPTGKANREMVLWDSTGLNPQTLGEQLGVRVRGGELSALGVDASAAGANGESSMYAAAVSLAMAGIDGTASIDFVHSCLAEPKTSRLSRELIWAVIALLAIIGGSIYAYQYLQTKEQALQNQKNQLTNLSDAPAKALKFVNMMTFAQYWHEDDPQYLACLHDLTSAMPLDSQTYATSIELKAETPAPIAVNSTTVATPNAQAPFTLNVTLTGKTSDSDHFQTFKDRLLRDTDTFANVQVPEDRSVNPKASERTFTITFIYMPPKAVKRVLQPKPAGQASH